MSGRGRSGAARQRMSLHCPPCSARAIFKLGGSSWPFCGPPALLCGMPQLSVASLASLSLSGAAEGHFGAWRGGEAKAVRSPAPCALLGLSPRELSPAPSPRPRSWRGWELPAGECWKSSASCATNDFLRQTIGAAGSYRSLLPIPDGSPVLFSPKSHPRAGQGRAALVPPEISGLCCSQVALEGVVKLTVPFSPLLQQTAAPGSEREVRVQGGKVTAVSYTHTSIWGQAGGGGAAGTDASRPQLT